MSFLRFMCLFFLYIVYIERKTKKALVHVSLIKFDEYTKEQPFKKQPFANDLQNSMIKLKEQPPHSLFKNNYIYRLLPQK